MENDITKIDPNFKVNDAFGREDVLLRSCREEPFSIHGVFHDGKLFRRLPSELAESVSPSIATLSKHTATFLTLQPADGGTSWLPSPSDPAP